MSLRSLLALDPSGAPTHRCVRSVLLRTVVLGLVCLHASLAYAQSYGDWKWNVLPENPTELDEVRVEVSYYWSSNVAFESEHTVNGANLDTRVDVCAGLLPVIGWWSHTLVIGRLAPGTYNVAMGLRFGSWDPDAGACLLNPVGSQMRTLRVWDSTGVDSETWSAIKRLYR